MPSLDGCFRGTIFSGLVGSTVPSPVVTGGFVSAETVEGRTEGHVLLELEEATGADNCGFKGAFPATSETQKKLTKKQTTNQTH